MSVEKSLLGKETDYPTTYQPEILFPIARAQAREQYADIAGIYKGQDWVACIRNFLAKYQRDPASCHWAYCASCNITKFD